MRILLQSPEGLKRNVFSDARKLEKDGHEVYLSSAPCYGACDLPLEEARMLNIDKLIHYGHARFMKKELPFEVEYREFHIKIDVSNLRNALKFLEGKTKISLVTTIQHIPQIDEMKCFLEGKGKQILIGKGVLTAYPAQVLGCDGTAAINSEADAILYVGDGKFHPTGIKTELPVFSLNPYSGECKQINNELEKIQKRRKGMLLKSLECKTFGILLSTKPGQFALNAAKKAKEKLEKAGLIAEILISNEFNPISLANFTQFECYITTACPRLSEDTDLFEKPILNVVDLDEFIILYLETHTQRE